MQRKAIKAGVIYAIKSDYGSPKPIVFLEDGAAGLYVRDRISRKVRKVTETGHTRARKGIGYLSPDYGYAAIRTRLDAADAISLIGSIGPAAMLSRFLADETPGVEGLEFEIVCSLGQIIPWAEAVAEFEGRRDADRKRTAETQARAERQRGIISAFAAFGVRVSASGSEYVGLRLDEAERLLALLNGEG